MDYEEMWRKLELEISGLKQDQVTRIHTAMLLGYMRKIERIEELEQAAREEK